MKKPRFDRRAFIKSAIAANAASANALLPKSAPAARTPPTLAPRAEPLFGERQEQGLAPHTRPQ